jgi:hypothetical protein
MKVKNKNSQFVVEACSRVCEQQSESLELGDSTMTEYSLESLPLSELCKRTERRKARRAEIIARDPEQFTLDELRILEPHLEHLEDVARRLHDELTAEEWDEAWYGSDRRIGLRQCVVMLFGLGRTHGPEILRSSLAYDLAYDRLDALLVGEAE